jgi:hypothetical protein
MNYFATPDVSHCGRFVQFEYIRSDECMRRAFALANRLDSLGDRAIDSNRSARP